MTTAAPLAPAARARFAWVDRARGIGIILVVYGHAARAIYPMTGTGWPAIADRLIYSFHMPLFFLLSGLFAWRSLARGRRAFLSERLVTVAWPYFLWSLVEGALALALPTQVNAPLGVRDLLLIPVVPIEQFWFLYTLFLCQLVLALCFPRRGVLAAVAVVGVIAVTFTGSGPMPLRAFAALPYVVVGILAARPFERIASRPGAALALVAAATALWGLTFGVAGALPILPLVVVIGTAGACGVVGLAMLLPPGAVSGTLALLGRASLAIYVLHTLFSAALRIGLRLVGAPLPTGWLLAVTTLVGLAGPLIVWVVAGRWRVRALFGLGERDRPGLGATAPRDRSGARMPIAMGLPEGTS